MGGGMGWVDSGGEGFFRSGGGDGRKESYLVEDHVESEGKFHRCCSQGRIYSSGIREDERELSRGCEVEDMMSTNAIRSAIDTDRQSRNISSRRS